jgi:hypothetical protein
VAVENWLPVIGYEGLYEVSDLGRVRSEPRTGTYGGLLAMTPRGSGYLSVHLSAGGRQRRRAVHLLVLEAFAEPRPAGQVARHGPGGKLDNRWPANLCWGTPPENMADKVRDGTDPAGARNGRARLDDATVTEMRRRHAAGEMQKALASEYGLSPAYAGRVIRGQYWGHLPVPPMPQHGYWKVGRPEPKVSGELAASARLNWAAVREARRRRAEGETIRGLARRFSVGYSTMFALLDGRTWREPGGEESASSRGMGMNIDSRGSLSRTEAR